MSSHSTVIGYLGSNFFFMRVVTSVSASRCFRTVQHAVILHQSKWQTPLVVWMDLSDPGIMPIRTSGTPYQLESAESGSGYFRDRDKGLSQKGGPFFGRWDRETSCEGQQASLIIFGGRSALGGYERY